MEGSKTAEILIQVDTNDTKAEKRYPFYFLPATRKRLKYMYIRIQAAITIIMNCPLFFHLFYAWMKPTVFKITSGEFFTKMIDECNRLYNTGTNSIPMNLKLVAAYRRSCR